MVFWFDLTFESKWISLYFASHSLSSQQQKKLNAMKMKNSFSIFETELKSSKSVISLLRTEWLASDICLRLSLFASNPIVADNWRSTDDTDGNTGIWANNLYLCLWASYSSALNVEIQSVETDFIGIKNLMLRNMKFKILKHVIIALILK